MWFTVSPKCYSKTKPNIGWLSGSISLWGLKSLNSECEYLGAIMSKDLGATLIRTVSSEINHTNPHWRTHYSPSTGNSKIDSTGRISGTQIEK